MGRNLQLIQLPSKECARSTWDNYGIQRLCSLGSTNKMDITRQIFLKMIGFIKLLLEVEAIKTDSVQSSSNYLQKLFTKNLLTAR